MWFYMGLAAAAVALDLALPLLVVLAVGLGLATAARVGMRKLRRFDPAAPPRGLAVLVTGASRGFGHRFALQLAGSGYIVYATVRKEEDSRALLGDWAQQQQHKPAGGGDVRPVVCDVAKLKDIEEAARWVEQDAERMQVELMAVVNNAGIQRLGPLETLDDAFLRYGFDVNVFGAVNVTRAFLAHLRRCQERRQVGPRIVFIGSVAGLLSPRFMSAYCATKHALEALVDGFRRELAGEGIRVTVIEPGSFSSNIVAEVPDTLKQLSSGDVQGEPSVMARYSKPYAKFLGFIDKAVSKLPDPQPVVDLLQDVLAARFPPARAVVGLDGYAAVVAGCFIPDAVIDLVNWLL